MLRRYNIFISLLLAVFCYPLVQIEVHAFEHRNVHIVMLLLKFICMNWNMFAVYATTVSFSEGAVETYFNVIEVINSGTGLQLRCLLFLPQHGLYYLPEHLRSVFT
jgi:hypothetical protein